MRMKGKCECGAQYTMNMWGCRIKGAITQKNCVFRCNQHAILIPHIFQVFWGYLRVIISKNYWLSILKYFY